MNHFAYVIVGAGFAGAATAYHLARRGIGDVRSFVETKAGVAATDTWTAQADWNADPMDGTGPS